MTNPTCPKTGQPMFRDVRPMTIAYKGHEATFDMPGRNRDLKLRAAISRKTRRISGSA